MKYLLINILVWSALFPLTSQTYFTRSGEITFRSEAPLEIIEAKNVKATSVLDMESGQVEWAVLIKAFKFEKALMEEHFNENYMESSMYPKATFKGMIQNISEVTLNTDDNYTVNISGDLEIHGVTQPISTTGIISINKGQVEGQCQFVLEVADYNIKIPKLVKDNIAKEVAIDIKAMYELLKNKKE